MTLAGRCSRAMPQVPVLRNGVHPGVPAACSQLALLQYMCSGASGPDQRLDPIHWLTETMSMPAWRALCTRMRPCAACALHALHRVQHPHYTSIPSHHFKLNALLHSP